MGEGQGGGRRETEEKESRGYDRQAGVNGGDDLMNEREARPNRTKEESKG